MGRLIAWHYPTKIAAYLADHTYVTCGNGAARWKCWGGDTGGKALRQGEGSTERANAIAGHDEKAGITCYLINGVCHQAANRILLPSKITVRGARGYYVSESLYGTYGRPRGVLGMCKAPFHQHTSVTGDLPKCQTKINTLKNNETDFDFVDIELMDNDEKFYSKYLSNIQSLYMGADIELFGHKSRLVDDAEIQEQSKRFQVKLFDTLSEFKLSSSFMDTKKASRLSEIRSDIEDQRFKLENDFQGKDTEIDEFVNGYNNLIKAFQVEVANLLSEEEYRKLFELKPDEILGLGDPDIAREAYSTGEGPYLAE